MELCKITDIIKSQSEQFVTLAHNMSDQSFNLPLSPGKWSLAQIINHLELFDIQVCKILTGLKTRNNRHSKLHISWIIQEQQDYSISYSAHSILLPTVKTEKKDQLIQQFIGKRQNVQTIITYSDLNLICNHLAHCHYGFLTGIEWITLLIKHTERHLHFLSQY